MVGIAALTYHAESLIFPGLFISTVWFQPYFFFYLQEMDQQIVKSKKEKIGHLEALILTFLPTKYNL